MKIEIELVGNGVIVRTRCVEMPDDVQVFETESENGDELYDGRAAAVWTIIDRLGWYGSKHDEKRLRVYVESREDEDAKS